MTTLVVEELKTTLTQTITLNRRAVIQAIRPRLYFHNDPAGTFTLAIKQGVTTIASKSLTMAEIITGASWAVNQYHHGFLNFQFDGIVILNPADYDIELSASGYTYADSAYVAWHKEHEFLTNKITDPENILTDLNKPLSLQIWSYQ